MFCLQLQITFPSMCLSYQIRLQLQITYFSQTHRQLSPLLFNRLSCKLIPLLFAASPRLFTSYAAAFTPSVSTLSFHYAPFHTTTRINMSDEVAAAKEAAQAYKSSDGDGAGPATVFDKILSGEWSSNKVHEDDLALAFRDISPQAPVHVIVIPKHRDGLTKLSNAREDQKDILGHLMYVAQMVGKKECPEGFRIVINDGEHGAQSVYHLHIHVLGGRQMGWPPG